jgi:hypothetical protein
MLDDNNWQLYGHYWADSTLTLKPTIFRDQEFLIEKKLIFVFECGQEAFEAAGRNEIFKAKYFIDAFSYGATIQSDHYIEI